jgi:hypothetical protein
MVIKCLAATRRLQVAAWIFLSLLMPAGARATSSVKVAIPTAPPEREIASRRFVLQRLSLWQERLNLSRWNIRVELVRASKLEPRTLGNIHWDTDAKQATIAVLSSYDYHLPFDAMLDDMEFTVVHELVHLQLAILPRSDASRRAEEHAVNELAGALLKLARQESPCE